MLKPRLLLVLLLLPGCVSSSPVHLANGIRAYKIECGMNPRGIAACLQAAGDVCGNRGFQLYDWFGAPLSRGRVEAEELEFQGTLAERQILVACRG